MPSGAGVTVEKCVARPLDGAADIILLGWFPCCCARCASLRPMGGVRHVRQMVVVPIREQHQLATTRLTAQRNQYLTCALILERPDQSLHHGNAAVLTDRAVARWRDGSAFGPLPKSVAIKDPVSIADDVFRRRAGASNRSSQKSANRTAVRPLSEDADVHDATRVVVDHDCHPPAERPAMRQRRRQPHGPESRADRHGRKIYMPHMVRFFRRHHATAGFGGLPWCRVRRLFQDATDGGDSQMKSRSAERLRDSDSTHARTQRLELPDRMTYEVGELVDRLMHLHQRVGSLFIEPLDPGANRGWGDVENVSGLLPCPAARGAQFQDGHPFDRWILGAVMRLDSLDAGTIDANLFTQQDRLLEQSILIGFQADACKQAVDRPTASIDRCILCQRDHVEHGRLDMPVPGFGELDTRGFHDGNRVLRHFLNQVN